MSKTIVDDIYSLVSKGVDKDKLEGALNESLPSLKEILQHRLSPTEIESKDLRMSSVGDKCLRKLWFRKNLPRSAEELQPWVKIKFMYGDIIEWFVLLLVSLSGHKVTGQQTELDIAGVKGHRDAIVDGTLIDVKSANSRSFEKFKNHDLDKNDPFGYLTQLSLYHSASKPELDNKDTAAFLAFDKEMGHIVYDEYKMPDKDWTEEVKAKKAIVDESRIMPPRGYEPVPHQKSGNQQLDLPCRYCEYKNTCHPGLRTFLYSSGPVYLTTVVKVPDVTEV